MIDHGPIDPDPDSDVDMDMDSDMETDLCSTRVDQIWSTFTKLSKILNTHPSPHH